MHGKQDAFSSFDIPRSLSVAAKPHYNQFIMIGANIKRAAILLLLPCLMLMAQSLALAHEFDHLAAGDGNPCVICPVSSNVEAAAMDCGETRLPQAPSAQVSFAPNTIRTDATRLIAVARAPPPLN
jgi:hypothetical protein